MEKKIPQPKDFSPEGQEMIRKFKDQCIIVLVNRLGGSVTLPVEEVDGTEPYNALVQTIPEGSDGKPAIKITVIKKEYM
jgi:hypothetical protein